MQLLYKKGECFEAGHTHCEARFNKHPSPRI